MANINQTITLGIGTPASIPYFLLFGLGINVVSDADVITMESISISPAAPSGIGIAAADMTDASVTTAGVTDATIKGET